MTYAEAITKRVMSLCKERDITLNKLATLSGMKQSTLENIVKGNTKNPSLRTLHRVAQPQHRFKEVHKYLAVTLVTEQTAEHKIRLR